MPSLSSVSGIRHGRRNSNRAGHTRSCRTGFGDLPIVQFLDQEQREQQLDLCRQARDGCACHPANALVLEAPVGARLAVWPRGSGAQIERQIGHAGPSKTGSVSLIALWEAPAEICVRNLAPTISAPPSCA